MRGCVIYQVSTRKIYRFPYGRPASTPRSGQSGSAVVKANEQPSRIFIPLYSGQVAFAVPIIQQEYISPPDIHGFPVGHADGGLTVEQDGQLFPRRWMKFLVPSRRRHEKKTGCRWHFRRNLDLLGRGREITLLEVYFRPPEMRFARRIGTNLDQVHVIPPGRPAM